MKIALDITNGDFAPNSTINGAINYLKNNKASEIVLLGTKDHLSKIKINSKFKSQISIVEANDLIESSDRPTRLIKNKPESSMIKAINMLKSKEVDAVISAGNTGCLLASSLMLLGKIENIKRPALAAFIPTENKGFVLCDVGANANNKPSHLLEFSIMAEAYIKYLEDVKNPKVALLNIGHESNKGNDLYVETFNLLNKKLNNFIGNIESRDLFTHKANIIVCDGFTGNIVLKLIEGLVDKMIAWTNESINNHSISKMVKPMLYPVFKDIKKSFDYEEHGGTPLLGIDGIVIKCHGSSKQKAIENAIIKAEKCIKNDFVNKIKNLTRNINNE